MSDKLDKAIKRFNRISCEILDNGLQTIEAINAGLGIIADVETQARAEMRAAEFTNCPACQSGLVPFIKDTPTADDTAIQAVTETLWESCPTCQAEYDDWADANAPEDVVLDKPSRWEVENGI